VVLDAVADEAEQVPGPQRGVERALVVEDGDLAEPRPEPAQDPGLAAAALAAAEQQDVRALRLDAEEDLEEQLEAGRAEELDDAGEREVPGVPDPFAAMTSPGRTGGALGGRRHDGLGRGETRGPARSSAARKPAARSDRDHAAERCWGRR
jgi:hypothetical protein